MSRFTFDTAIERGDDEIEVRVTYEVSPFIEQTYWQPAEGGEVEIVEADFVGVGPSDVPAPLTDGEFDALQAAAEARARDDMEIEAADEADYRYEQYRDRLMTDAWEQGA